MKRKRAPGAGRPRGSSSSAPTKQVRTTEEAADLIDRFHLSHGGTKVEASARLIEAGFEVLGDE